MRKVYFQRLSTRTVRALIAWQKYCRIFTISIHVISVINIGPGRLGALLKRSTLNLTLALDDGLGACQAQHYKQPDEDDSVKLQQGI